MDEEVHPWTSLFVSSESEYYGYVTDIDDAYDVIEEFAYSTHTNYVFTRGQKNFGKFNLKDSQTAHLLRFEDDGRVVHGSKIQSSGVPFMVVGSKLMECHQGPNRNKGITDSLKKHESDHNYKLAPQKKRTLGSKKLGCSASIYLREVIAFPEYKVQQNTEYHKRESSEKLRTAMQSPNYEDIKVEKYIYIDLPAVDTHCNHIMGDAADLKAPIDHRVLRQINELVDQGTVNIGEMKRHVRLFVKGLFKDNSLPQTINRRFFPSRQDIRKLIYRQRQRNMQGLLDQEYLEEKIKLWKQEHPQHFWFFRPKAQVSDDDDAHSDDTSLLIVHQTDWQQQLMHRYGTELVFLDATYKTTQYAVPLFFICVNTNSGYIVVATIIMEREDSISLAEGLGVLAKRNPEWSPRGFMIDSSEIEMNAIHQTFPAAEVLICDFHRKQAWLRWTSAHRNGVIDCQSEILSLLNNLAESVTLSQYEDRLCHLKASQVWKNNPNLQNYIEKQWIGTDKYKKWVWAFRSPFTLVVNTNNGVEAQNKVFKYDYLTPCKSKSLSSLLICLVEDFLQDSFRNYVCSNVTMSSGWRDAKEDIPADLRHRPLHLIRHLRAVHSKAADITAAMIKKEEDTYLVSSSSSQKVYEVSLGSENQMPSCQCYDFRKTHLPCKHFAAVFAHCNITWTQLPHTYCNHPVFTIDDEMVGLAAPSGFQESTTPATLAFSELPESSLTDEEEVPELAVEEKTEKHGARLQTEAKRFRDYLSKLHTLSFLLTSPQTLMAARTQLEAIHQNLLEECPNSNGLLLEHPTKKQKKEKKVKHVHWEDLPVRRKYKRQRGNTITCPKESVKRSKLSLNKTKHKHGEEFSAGEILHKSEKNALTILKDYASGLKEDQWACLIQASRKLGSVAGRRAAAILECSEGTEQEYISAIQQLIPVPIPKTELVNLLFEMLSELVGRGLISLAEDPAETDRKAAEAMKELSSCIIDMNEQGDSVTEPTSIKITEEEEYDNLIMQLKLSEQKPTDIKASKWSRFYVCGEVLEARDLKSLTGRNWLNDKVINAYLRKLMEENNKETEDHIYVLPSYLAVLWDNGRFDTWLYKRVELTLFKWVFLPININGNHWVLLVANIPNRSVSMLDSLSLRESLQYLDKWRKFMQIRCKKSQTDSLMRWRDGALKSAQQTDGNSCGAFVMLNALALRRNITNHLHRLTQDDAVCMRSHVFTALTTSCKKAPNERDTCDMVGCVHPGRKMSWIGCDVCGRWCHYKCVNIKKAPKDDFVCVICNAQYA